LPSHVSANMGHLQMTSVKRKIYKIDLKLLYVNCVKYYKFESSHNVRGITVAGRAIAQAVSRQLPTVTVGVRAQVRSCGICGEQNGTGAVFS
jgi:hypothetical protein